MTNDMKRKNIYTSPSFRVVNVRPKAIICGSPFRLDGNVDVDEYEDYDFDIIIQ